MLNRIRATVAGDAPESPRHTQQHAAASHQHSPANPSTPQRAGLFGFLKQPSDLPPPPHNNNSNNNSSSSTPMGPAPGGFFGSLMGSVGASPTPPSPMEPDSPRTIRASAAALLKFSTTPPLFNAAGETTLNSTPSASSGNNNSNNNNDNHRVTALEEQINKRDQHIMKLEHDLQKMQHQHSQLTKDNTTIRRQQLESTHRHAVAIRLWRRTNDGLAARVDCFEKETTPSAAREIANLIRDAAPPNKDSAYLMMLQDQLSKATAKLDHLSSQTEIVLHKGEEVVESLREEMNEVIRERCRMEIELMDQEYMLGEDMKRLVIRTERRLKRVQGEIDFLEKNAVEALKNQEGEGDEEEDGSDDEGGENDKNDVEENKSDEENDVEGNKDKDEGEGADQEKDDQTDETETEKTSKEDHVDDDDDQEKEAEAKSDENANPEDEPRNEGSNSNGANDIKKNEEEDQKPEVLRHELRKIAMERDRCLSVLQKKLREKNEEFMTLVKLKESRTKAIEKIEKERRDRDEWERSRGEEIIP